MSAVSNSASTLSGQQQQPTTVENGGVGVGVGVTVTAPDGSERDPSDYLSITPLLVLIRFSTEPMRLYDKNCFNFSTDSL